TSLLPGVWATCLAFSAAPEELLSGQDFKSFVAAVPDGSMRQEEENLDLLRERYASLQREYQE
ncbi:MAG TPA: hypothetical protein PKC25_12890, partial [Candidatus Rifleibacterium sp.]|nr:hypothetical protein [Candidatus Rifleibacterium sp.]